MKLATGIVLAILLMVFSKAYSQERYHQLSYDTISLNEVVVTGTTVRVNRHNIPMAVTVVNNLQIRESNETSLLPALNGRVPGLFVTERGVMGFGVAANAAGQISIRGIGGSPTTGVLMLIDGHPQFMGIFGHPLPDSYIASDVERVEVIRGPGSILYGSNAMGGVINIITRKQEQEGVAANAHFMYGSYNTQKYMGSVGFRKEGFSLFASVNRDQTDGHRANSEFGITNGYIKAGFELSPSVNLSTDFSLLSFATTDPGPDTINAVKGNTLDIRRGYWSFTADNSFNSLSGSMKLFWNFGEHRISDGFHSNDANYGLNIFQAVKLFKGNTLTLGADYLRYGGRAENEKAMGGAGIVFKDTMLYDAGVYGFIQQSLFEKLTLNAGIRLQSHQVYGREWVPAGGFAYRLNNETTLKGSLSKGFRSPTIQELFIWNHNINLRPSTIFSYEAGVLRSFIDSRVKLEFTGYVVNGDDLIIAVPMQGLQNAGSVNNRGLEFSGSGLISEKLQIDVTYSYIKMKSPVYATPEHHFYINGTYSLKRLRLSSSVQYVEDLDSDPGVGVSLQDYVLWNGKVTFRALKFGELFLTLENILGTQYENNRYYTMPGLTFYGGLKLRL